MSFNKKPIQVAILTVTTSVLLGGCMSSQPTREPTPEERAQAYEMRQAFIERLRNSQLGIVPAAQTHKKTAEVEVPKVSEQELAKQIAELNSNATSGNKVERVRDGLLINGKAYLDPEGSIIDFAVNPLNGSIVYAIKANSSTRVFKYMNAGSNGLPVTLGTAVESGRDTVFHSASGQSLNGRSVIPTSTGVLVTRTGSAFLYEPGKRVVSVIVPDSYHVAPVQRGDVGSTKYILLEKNKVDEKKEPFGSLLSSLTSIGSTLGAVKADDYVLFNIENQNKVVLDISVEGKNVAQYSNCEKVNFAVNSCSSVNFYNSLYKPDGTRNIGHYYWRVAWFNTDSGVYAVAGEGGARQINLINLNERKKATILERTLGINGYNTTQLPDGKIAIEAKMGFSTETVDDAVAKYNQSNPTVIAAK